MCLVNGNILKAEFLERRFLDEANLVTGNADLEVLWNKPIRDDLRALFLRSGEDQDIEVWSSLFELARPVLQG